MRLTIFLLFFTIPNILIQPLSSLPSLLLQLFSSLLATKILSLSLPLQCFISPLCYCNLISSLCHCNLISSLCHCNSSSPLFATTIISHLYATAILSPLSLCHYKSSILYDNTIIISCCCLPTPMTLASGGSLMFPLVVHQPASPSIWPAVQSLRRGLSTNPGAPMWCVCGCS